MPLGAAHSCLTRTDAPCGYWHSCTHIHRKSFFSDFWFGLRPIRFGKGWNSAEISVFFFFKLKKKKKKKALTLIEPIALTRQHSLFIYLFIFLNSFSCFKVVLAILSLSLNNIIVKINGQKFSLHLITLLNCHFSILSSSNHFSPPKKKKKKVLPIIVVRIVLFKPLLWRKFYLHASNVCSNPLITRRPHKLVGPTYCKTSTPYSG